MGFIQKLFSGEAGSVINAVGTVLGKVITTEGERMQIALELKKAERQFEVDMKNLSLEEQRVILGDIDSARKRDQEVQISAHATKLGKNVPPILAIGTTLLTFTLFGILMFYDKSLGQDRREITIYILGVLSAVLTQIFGFYFGSSQGSMEKNSTIRASMHQFENLKI